jgi:thymidylate synthase (FAD)
MNVELVDHMGNDLSVVNAARVSFAKTSEFDLIPDEEERLVSTLKKKDIGLIKFLAKHKHWTPFAHTAITLRMQAPIPIRTQAFKHKIGLVENEESRRYINSEPSFYMPTFRQQADDKKQGSGEEFIPLEQEILNALYKSIMERAVIDYKSLLEKGVCEEQARFVLPQGCEVNWFWTGNLVSFANFVQKRTDPTAQGEIQDLARMVNKTIAPLYPVAWEALTWHLD